MKAGDIADLRVLRPRAALALLMDRHVVRLGNMLAGNVSLPKERVRYAGALLAHLGNAHFCENPELNRDLIWDVCEFEQTNRCERAGAALFVAHVSGRAMTHVLEKKVTTGLVDQLATLYQYALDPSLTVRSDRSAGRRVQQGIARGGENGVYLGLRPG